MYDDRSNSITHDHGTGCDLLRLRHCDAGVSPACGRYHKGAGWKLPHQLPDANATSGRERRHREGAMAMVALFSALSMALLLCSCAKSNPKDKKARLDPADTSVLSIDVPLFSGGAVGEPFLATLSAKGGAEPYSWSLTGTLPPGLSLSKAGVIEGLPLAEGAYDFELCVADAKLRQARLSLSFAISPIDDAKIPRIVTKSLAAGTVGRSYSKTLRAEGGVTPYTWKVTDGELPGGLHLDAKSGRIGGVPTQDDVFLFEVTVTDAARRSGVKWLSITIKPVDSGPGAPSITTSSLSAGTAGVAYSRTLAATGGTLPYEWSISSGTLPAGLVLDGDTGEIFGTPTASGTANFEVTVTDTATETDDIDLSIVIDPASGGSSAPSITTSSLSDGTAGIAYSRTMAASGGTTPHQWSISSGALPAGLTLDQGTGEIFGTPSAAGTANFEITVTDAASETDDIDLSIVINPASVSPG